MAIVVSSSPATHLLGMRHGHGKIARGKQDPGKGIRMLAWAAGSLRTYLSLGMMVINKPDLSEVPIRRARLPA